MSIAIQKIEILNVKNGEMSVTNDFEEAELMLNQASKNAPKMGGYDSFEVLFVWADGTKLAWKALLSHNESDKSIYSPSAYLAKLADCYENSLNYTNVVPSIFRGTEAEYNYVNQLSVGARIAAGELQGE